MSAHEDLLAAIEAIGERSGNPNVWQTGLTPDEVAEALSAATAPERVVAILNKIRQLHPCRFQGTPPGLAPGGVEGDAADAMAAAEIALAQQNSASSQLDMHVVSAILNAHARTVDGCDALNKLQREIETAVRSRTDLDTPAGARDFQRFLIGKLRDIHALIAGASLDDASKSALLAAWTSLYEVSKRPEREARSAAPEPDRATGTTLAPATGEPNGVDSQLIEDPGLLGGDTWSPDSASAAPAAPASAAPTIPIPNPGMAPMPGALPGLGSMAGWGEQAGLPLAGRLGDGDTARELKDAETKGHGDRLSPDETDEHEAESTVVTGEPVTAGSMVVTLPDGQVVTVSTPQLAAVIKAAIAGTPIAEAFTQQGMTIPAPGTAVAEPIDASRVSPGDIGMFTDRHALAVGESQAILDGQILRISDVGGPSFLGWEHPPAPAPATAPAHAATPTPTRPAAVGHVTSQ